MRVEDLVAALDPRFLEIDAKWYVRGGITTYVRVVHGADARPDGSGEPW